ncbi:hypothetical protein CALCODRAFT_243749 [Calocera cornea HHB12733]|uniref:Uncharacterized protein n=1 Tax=Calocera cornea HHB12733 TaxID=1353952 RepID=A0A165GR07_9BASI|nr:hypothetical protein CALCODRAFT_243749 [Calocera cornea HHB12733]
MVVHADDAGVLGFRDVLARQDVLGMLSEHGPLFWCVWGRAVLLVPGVIKSIKAPPANTAVLGTNEVPLPCGVTHPSVPSSLVKSMSHKSMHTFGCRSSSIPGYHECISTLRIQLFQADSTSRRGIGAQATCRRP